jgi:hypothetical protein
MTRSTWQEISAELDADMPAPREIKRQLAHHGWCDLFVGLIQVVDTSRDALDRIPDGAKSLVKAAILHSSMQGKRKQVTGAVVDVVVDKEGYSKLAWPLLDQSINHDKFDLYLITSGVS